MGSEGKILLQVVFVFEDDGITQQFSKQKSQNVMFLLSIPMLQNGLKLIDKSFS